MFRDIRAVESFINPFAIELNRVKFATRRIFFSSILGQTDSSIIFLYNSLKRNGYSTSLFIYISKIIEETDV